MQGSIVPTPFPLPPFLGPYDFWSPITAHSVVLTAARLKVRAEAFLWGFGILEARTLNPQPRTLNLNPIP